MALQSLEEEEYVSHESVHEASDAAILIGREEDKQKMLGSFPGPMEEKAQVAKKKYLAAKPLAAKARTGKQTSEAEDYESDKISIRTSDQHAGKSVVAMKKISAGTVIFCEKPFACALSKEFKGTRCEGCFKLLGLAKMA